MSSGRSAVILVVLLSAVAEAGPARAEVAPASTAPRAELERIALVDADPVLARAVGETLAPWGITVVVVRPLAPGDSMPGSADRARELADQYGAGAVAWISKSESGYALWVYDHASGRVVARRLLSPPPFDEPTATAVALSIKTLLRHSEVAPSTQRYAGSPPEQQRLLELEAIGGMQLRDTGSWRAESQLGIGLVWWPSIFRGRVGASAGGQAGVGLAVTESAFVGHYSERSLTAGIRGRIDLGGGFALAPILTGALHFSSLTGLETGGDESVEVKRLNPGVDGALQIELRVSPVTIGFRLGASYLAARQRYLIRGEAILQLPAISMEGCLTLRLPLH